jgi:hypothetical protein
MTFYMFLTGGKFIVFFILGGRLVAMFLRPNEKKRAVLLEVSAGLWI